MQLNTKIIITGFSAFVISPASHAAPVTWGTVQAITSATDLISTGSNGHTISGSATMNSLPGEYVVGTFTADGPTQVLSVTTTSGGFAVANAFTIGTVIPEPSAALLGALGPLGLRHRLRN
jgi:hypothetical protein